MPFWLKVSIALKIGFERRRCESCFHSLCMRIVSIQNHWAWASCQIRKIAGCACAGNDGNVFPPPRVSDPDMHYGTCVTHVPWCMPGSLTSGFIGSRRRGKRSRHSRRMRNHNFTYLTRGPLSGTCQLQTNQRVADAWAFSEFVAKIDPCVAISTVDSNQPDDLRWSAYQDWSGRNSQIGNFEVNARKSHPNTPNCHYWTAVF